MDHIPWKYLKPNLRIVEVYGWVNGIVCLVDTWMENKRSRKRLKMPAAEVEEEDGFRPTKYPRFRIASGGKGPPEPPEDTTNWLAEYEPGTSFVSMRINSKDCDYELFHVVFCSLPDVILLKWQLPDGKIWDKYVDPAVFSKMFKRGIILGIVKPEEPQQEVEGEKDVSTGERDPC